MGFLFLHEQLRDEYEEVAIMLFIQRTRLRRILGNVQSCFFGEIQKKDFDFLNLAQWKFEKRINLKMNPFLTPELISNSIPK